MCVFCGGCASALTGGEELGKKLSSSGSAGRVGRCTVCIGRARIDGDEA